MNIRTPFDDSLSFGLSIAALLILIYLATFVDFSTVLLIPTILLLGGWVLQIVASGKIQQDPKIEGNEAKGIVKYTLIALIGIMIGSFAIPGLFTPPTSSTIAVSGSLTALYVVLYAIAEERFFRGGINTFLMWKVPNQIVAIAMGALIFAVYHLAVYSASIDKIAYVFVAGFMFGYAAYKTGRLTSSKLAHIINNLLSIGFFGGR